MIVAQGIPDFGLSEGLLHVVRVIASVGGAVVGWFLCDLLSRLVYRLTFKGATPGGVVLLSKFGGAVSLALLIYFFMPLGGGGGGLGWGPGMGGSPGKGPGQGGDKGQASDGAGKDAKASDKAKTDAGTKSSAKVEMIQIEILGGERFEDDGKKRFYLVERKKPAKSIEDLDEYFKAQEAKIAIEAVLTKHTGIRQDLAGSPLDRLRECAKLHKIKVVTLNED